MTPVRYANNPIRSIGPVSTAGCTGEAPVLPARRSLAKSLVMLTPDSKSANALNRWKTSRARISSPAFAMSQWLRNIDDLATHPARADLGLPESVVLQLLPDRPYATSTSAPDSVSRWKMKFLIRSAAVSCAPRALRVSKISCAFSSAARSITTICISSRAVRSIALGMRLTFSMLAASHSRRRSSRRTRAWTIRLARCSRAS